jgi:hypothetical protein
MRTHSPSGSSTTQTGRDPCLAPRTRTHSHLQSLSSPFLQAVRSRSVYRVPECELTVIRLRSSGLVVRQDFLSSKWTGVDKRSNCPSVTAQPLEIGHIRPVLDSAGQR